MPNELRFEVEMTRDQVSQILKNQSVSLVVVSGTYTYRPDLGEHVWKMDAFAEGYDDKLNKITDSPTSVCPRPCP